MKMCVEICLLSTKFRTLLGHIQPYTQRTEEAPYPWVE
jgi:hypothetical protein